MCAFEPLIQNIEKLSVLLNKVRVLKRSAIDKLHHDRTRFSRIWSVMKEWWRVWDRYFVLPCTHDLGMYLGTYDLFSNLFVFIVSKAALIALTVATFRLLRLIGREIMA